MSPDLFSFGGISEPVSAPQKVPALRMTWFRNFATIALMVLFCGSVLKTYLK